MPRLHRTNPPQPSSPRHLACALWAAAAALSVLPAMSGAATAVVIGATGKTFASAAPQCAVHPVTGQSTPVVQAGLFNPRRQAEAHVSLDGAFVQQVDREIPATDIWLTAGSHTVVVALSRRQADQYAFQVSASQCNPPVTTGNFLSPDGTLEYAASGKSYLMVTPGCALNPATGSAQPFVNLFDNGSFLLNVSVNGVALTQLSATRPRAVVFLRAGANVVTAANGTLSTDTFVRDGGSGSCTP